MKREVRERANDLRISSVKLRHLYNDTRLSYKKSRELQEKQTDKYKRYLFYKGIINAKKKGVIIDDR